MVDPNVKPHIRQENGRWLVTFRGRTAEFIDKWAAYMAARIVWLRSTVQPTRQFAVYNPRAG